MVKVVYCKSVNRIANLLKKIAESLFVVQVDPWTREVNKRRVTVFIVVVFLIIGGIIFNTMVKPLDVLRAADNDKKRILDLDKLKVALIKFQEDTGNLPQISQGVRFLAGGVGSSTTTSANWLGVDLSKYLDSVPIDPKFLQNSTAPYPYRYTTDGFSFKLDAYLETNPDNLMQLDGGVFNEFGNSVNNRTRYEVGTNLLLRF